jgi:hypothetical protein
MPSPPPLEPRPQSRIEKGDRCAGRCPQIVDPDAQYTRQLSHAAHLDFTAGSGFPVGDGLPRHADRGGDLGLGKTAVEADFRHAAAEARAGKTHARP